MVIRWTPEAAANLESIQTYLNVHHTARAASTINEIYNAILSLEQYPFRGRIGLRLGTREFVLPHLPYIVFYRTIDQTVEILYIHHGAQQPRE